MASRVFKHTNSNSYQVFSSLFLASLILLSCLILFIGLTSFAYYPFAFEMIILFCFIHNPYTNANLKRVIWLLKQNQKPAARELLGATIRRDCNRLTYDGMIKATLEYQALNFLRCFFIPLLLFYLFGFEVSIAYCLLITIGNAYSAATTPNSAFNLAINAIIYVFEYIPLRLFCVPLLLKPATQSFHYIKLYLANSYNKNSVFVLCCLSGALACQLGGPAYYSGIRYSKVRVGTQRLPDFKDLVKAKKQLMACSLFWFSLLLFLEFIYVFAI